MVLSANGNLQRLISSYHNSPVSVRVRFNRRLSHGLYAREVTLSVFGTRFAVATSSVRLERADCIAAVEERGVGIGQLFRHLNILPDFELLAAGTLEAGAPLPPEAALSAATDGDADGGGGGAGGGAGDGDDDADVARFWRRYVLSGEGVRCEIREVACAPTSFVFSRRRRRGRKNPSSARRQPRRPAVGGEGQLWRHHDADGDGDVASKASRRRSGCCSRRTATSSASSRASTPSR